MKIEEGQVAIVTGAASGIGRKLCAELAGRGVRLVMADIDRERLDAAVAEIGAISPAVAQPCNVSQDADIVALRANALAAFGRIDLVFNNAGVVLPFRPMWEHSADDWEWLMGINLRSVVHGIRTFVPDMVSQGSGHIINTASMAGVSVLPFNGPYNAAKHAVVSLTETLAAELAQQAPGVRATVVCPGRVPTRIGSKGPDNGTAPRSPLAPGAEANTIDVALAVARIIGGIEADKVYIFTHPGSRERIAARFAGVRDGLEAWN
jgi:NAD(P)-dependent dehydrogenase (short-subunit alcohol dehydrogenase family)